jgi:hypothetical protein
MHKYQRKHGILSCRAGLDGRTDGNVNWTVLMMVQIEVVKTTLPLQIKNHLPILLHP